MRSCCVLLFLPLSSSWSLRNPCYAILWYIYDMSCSLNVEKWLEQGSVNISGDTLADICTYFITIHLSIVIIRRYIFHLDVLDVNVKQRGNIRTPDVFKSGGIVMFINWYSLLVNWYNKQRNIEPLQIHSQSVWCDTSDFVVCFMYFSIFVVCFMYYSPVWLSS